MESDVHLSLHPNCLHQIVFAKFDLTIFYPQPYSRGVWDHGEAKTDTIKRAIIKCSFFSILNPVGKKPSVTLMLLRKYLPSMKQS